MFWPFHPVYPAIPLPCRLPVDPRASRRDNENTLFQSHVAKLFPEFGCRHLLEMTSGLELDDDRDNPFSDIVRMHLGTDVTSVALSIEAKEEPGKFFEYNNANSQRELE